MKDTLEHRFTTFLSSLPGAENIDCIDMPVAKRDRKKADFFLNNRSVVVEVKSIKTDTSHKVEKVLKPHRDRPEFPVFYGEMHISKILAHLPDGEEINQEIFQKITHSVEAAFKKADDQIASTKDTFSVNEAWGLLVILNEYVDILSPDVLSAKITKMLCKKLPDGSYRYQQIAWVWIISEGHYLQVHPQLKSLPLIAVEGPSAESRPNSRNYIDWLQHKWAAHDGAPLILLDKKMLEGLNFGSFAKDAADNRPVLPRHEHWRRQYRRNPYLRAWDKARLSEFGTRLILEIKPYVLKGGPKASEQKMSELMAEWTHFLEEVNFRGIDMRELVDPDGYLD